MSVRQRLIPDHLLRRAIIAGVVLVVAGTLLSQVMMQIGGGPRAEAIDLAHQFPEGSPEAASHVAVFPDGMPPFISSGGAFQPERTVFDVSLGLGGLLMIAIVIDQTVRIRAAHVREGAHPVRRVANLLQLGSGLVVGGSMVMITRHPFTESLVLHIAFAMAIFHGAIVWTGALAAARGSIDRDLDWRGIGLTRLRWGLFAATLASYEAMVWLIAGQRIVASAFFEWTLTFSAEACMLTLLPAIVTGQAGGDDYRDVPSDGGVVAPDPASED